jgi:hypothetical protein
LGNSLEVLGLRGGLAQHALVDAVDGDAPWDFVSNGAGAACPTTM